jgi:hypothetical protein
MNYVVTVPFEVSRPLTEADPDVRSISRLPGFVRLEPISASDCRYELTVEVEAGSHRDAIDASEELLVEYENALGTYRVRRLTGVAPQPA